MSPVLTTGQDQAHGGGGGQTDHDALVLQGGHGQAHGGGQTVQGAQVREGGHDYACRGEGGQTDLENTDNSACLDRGKSFKK